MPQWLFSYGSNSPAQLAERLGHGVTAYGAWATGWQRVYRRWSERWAGGTASLVRSKGHNTYGNACLLSDDDLIVLDQYEGVAGGAYHRTQLGVVVRLADGDLRTPAVAYVTASRERNRPSQAYLRAVANNVGAFWSSSAGKKLRPGDFDNDL